MSEAKDEPRRERKAKKQNPSANLLVKGILIYYERRRQHQHQHYDQISPADRPFTVPDLPKRYTTYAPLLLLPHNFASHSPRWADFYSTLDKAQRQDLFQCIADEGFRKMGISRVGINAPIAAEMDEGRVVEESTSPNGRGDSPPSEFCPDGEAISSPTGKPSDRNVLRSPAGLLPVYGDWSPPVSLDKQKSRILNPTAQDFAEAFWTSTSQHQGITQVWAPLYTMFSRGNISEKARILGLSSTFPGLQPYEIGDGEVLGGVDVVDLYVGIGYFASCYLKSGVRRVYGWDINPWSVEGLRRGCERNEWGCLIVRVDGEGNVLGEEGGIKGVAATIREADEGGVPVRCVAFLGDNRWAGKGLQELDDEFERMEEAKTLALNVRHVNLGLLPTSRASWRNAVGILAGMGGDRRGGWIHVHENVDVHEIEDMAGKIVKELGVFVDAVSSTARLHVSCKHIEQVKTYAPGVMHCVFDIEIRSNG